MIRNIICYIIVLTIISSCVDSKVVSDNENKSSFNNPSNDLTVGNNQNGEELLPIGNVSVSELTLNENKKTIDSDLLPNENNNTIESQLYPIDNLNSQSDMLPTNGEVKYDNDLVINSSPSSKKDNNNLNVSPISTISQEVITVDNSPVISGNKYDNNVNSTNKTTEKPLETKTEDINLDVKSKDPITSISADNNNNSETKDNQKLSDNNVLVNEPKMKVTEVSKAKVASIDSSKIKKSNTPSTPPSINTNKIHHVVTNGNVNTSIKSTPVPTSIKSNQIVTSTKVSENEVTNTKAATIDSSKFIKSNTPSTQLSINKNKSNQVVANGKVNTSINPNTLPTSTKPKQVVTSAKLSENKKEQIAPAVINPVNTKEDKNRKVEIKQAKVVYSVDDTNYDYQKLRSMFDEKEYDIIEKDNFLYVKKKK